MTQREAKQRLSLLKYSQELDVYYQVKLLKNNVWVLENRINKHSDYAGKNVWLGFTNFVTPNEDGTFTIRCFYVQKDKDYKNPIFIKNNVPIHKCLYWMKQFYSAVRWTLNEYGVTPQSVEELEESDEFKKYYNKLKHNAENHIYTDITKD